MTSTPNPGSDEAVALGCSCPVLDNGHGKGAMGGRLDDDGHPVFWQDALCPVHHPPTGAYTVWLDGLPADVQNDPALPAALRIVAAGEYTDATAQAVAAYVRRDRRERDPAEFGDVVE